MSGVVNDQIANQTTFNNAFMARNGDTSAGGKIDLLNQAIDAASGTDIVNLQKNINALCSALGITPNQAMDLVITWANAHVGGATSSAVAKIEALVLKFRDTAAHGGHAHTGADGDGSQISAMSLSNFNTFRSACQSVAITGASGTSVDISTQMAGKVSGGTSTGVGVITTAPLNRVDLITNSTQISIQDSGGQRVYGRITYSTGVWTLSFFTNEAGVETAHSLTSADILIYFQEVFTVSSVPTIPVVPVPSGGGGSVGTTPPTVTRLTTVGTTTYTTPAGCTRLEVELVGSGAGGSGSSTDGVVNTGSPGAAATIDSTTTAKTVHTGGSLGGYKPIWGAGSLNSGNGGQGLGSGTGITTIHDIKGGKGMVGPSALVTGGIGWPGGGTHLAGMNQETTPPANTGVGGRGGSSGSSTLYMGNGGGGGGYWKGIIIPAAGEVFTCVVPAGGAGGAAGTSGAAGGTGADGLIVFTAHF